jgi:TPR repeat protein
MKKTIMLLLCVVVFATHARAVTLEEATRAAAQGDSNAEYALGVMYAKGQGVPSDIKKAVEWLNKAAAHGNKHAQFELGVIVYNGKLVEQDYARAFSLFSDAANQGVLDAQYNLGVMHKAGQGVPKDSKKAYELFLSAAEKGVRNAQLNLCGMFMFGENGPVDLISAYKWCLLSDLIPGETLKGNVGLASASHTAWGPKRLSREDMALAEQQADAWLAKRNRRRTGIVTYPLMSAEDATQGK